MNREEKFVVSMVSLGFSVRLGLRVGICGGEKWELRVEDGKGPLILEICRLLFAKSSSASVYPTLKLSSMS